MVERSAEALKTLRALDSELAAVGARTGITATWTAAEEAILSLIGDQIDRKVQLLAEYAQAVDAKDRTRFSGEVRLLENSIARMLKQVKIDEPTPPRYESQATNHARTAAMKRWHPGWTPGATG